MSTDPDLDFGWRAPVTDDEMVDLVRAHGGHAVAGWWDRIRPHSLGWVSARDGGVLVGFVNVAWDGGDHAFLVDTKTRRPHQHRGIGTRLVRTELGPFYFDACGFHPTAAGLIHLSRGSGATT